MNNQEEQTSRQLLPRRKYFTPPVMVGLKLLPFILLTILVLVYFTDIFTFIGGILNMLTPFFIGFALAFILKDLLKLIEKGPIGKIKNHNLRRLISVMLTMLIFIVIVLMALMIILPQIIDSIYTFFNNLPSYIGNVKLFINELFIKYELDDIYIARFYDYIQKQVDTVLFEIGENLPLIFDYSTKIFSQLTTIILSLILCVYLLFSKETFILQAKKLTYAIFNKTWADRFLATGRLANTTFTGFASGKILDSLIVGIICFIVLYALKYPYASLVSMIIGITNIIPIFGPIFGAIPAFFIVLMADPLRAFWLLVFILILQQIDGNIIGPKILGNSTGLPAIWVLFALLIGGGLFGLLGMLLAVPTFAVIYKIFREIMRERLQQKNLFYTDTDTPQKPAKSKSIN